MLNTICDFKYDKYTVFALVVIDNIVYTRCFHLDTGIIVQHFGSDLFFTKLKSCAFKKINKLRKVKKL